MTTHSSILAWKIQRAGEPGRLYNPWGRKKSDTTERLSTHTILNTSSGKRKEMENSMFKSSDFRRRSQELGKELQILLNLRRTKRHGKGEKIILQKKKYIEEFMEKQVGEKGFCVCVKGQFLVSPTAPPPRRSGPAAALPPQFQPLASRSSGRGSLCSLAFSCF